MQNILNINLKLNYIKELENEIKLFRSYYKYSDGEKLILIKFISTNQEVNIDIIAKNTDLFSKIEPILYEKYPKYTDLENYFLFKGKKISRNRSLIENKINNNDKIILVNNID